MASKIVLIDDDAGVALELGKSLADSGWSLVSYDDPDRALTEFPEHHPAIVIVDIRMPTMDGDEILAELQEANLLAAVRVFAVSSVAPPRVIWKRFEPFGATFLAKDSLGNREALLELFEGIQGA